MARLMLVGIGVVMIVLAAALGRGGRLSMGHAAAWFWVGLGALLLVLAAALLRLSDTVLAYAGLLWAAGAGIGFGLAHARAETRLDERVRFLAQEVALLGGAGDPAATASSDTRGLGGSGRQRGGD